MTITIRRLLIAAIGGVLLLGFLGGLAWLPRTYQSQASVVLTAPRQVASQQQGNPTPSRALSLSFVAHALRQMITAPGTVSSLGGQGYPEPYAVTMSASGAAGPALTITVTGRDRAMVQATLAAVLARLYGDIGGLDGRMPGPGRINITPLPAASQADLAVSQTARPYLIVAVLGLVLVLGVPVATDGLAARRRAAREAVRDRAGGLVPDMTGMVKG
ncbi:MAG: hypothetical protein ACYCO9_00930 [Streptosporangiaceae bacterium]